MSQINLTVYRFRQSEQKENWCAIHWGLCIQKSYRDIRKEAPGCHLTMTRWLPKSQSRQDLPFWDLDIEKATNHKYDSYLLLRLSIINYRDFHMVLKDCPHTTVRAILILGNGSRSTETGAGKQMRQVSKWVTIFKVINSPAGCHRAFGHRIDLWPQDVKWMQDKLTVVYPRRWWPNPSRTARIQNRSAIPNPKQYRECRVAAVATGAIPWFMTHKRDRFTSAAQRRISWMGWYGMVWYGKVCCIAWYRISWIRLIYPAYWLAPCVMGNFMPSAVI